ncbi:helix-turn-helix domain-containing protein [Cetobacterium somerae]|uniref:helix-turn-helix domain-containing protein n=1 Tax=Cetobacterium somerae TaxID=188913 RepID=UPI00248EF1E2|nr:helix-turn-helix domain-containing protein [Cetobacterium somerae]
MQDLSPALFKTYAAINKLADNEVGYCFATNESISIKLNKHEKSISRDISELIELGYLFANQIKIGFKVIERRLYTAENIKTYMNDQKNISNLIKTTMVEKDKIFYYYNETNSTGNKSVTRKYTGNKIEDGTSNNFEERTGNKNVTVTNTNITNTNSTTTETNTEQKKESSSSQFLNILDSSTKANILSSNPNITEEEFNALYEKCKLEVQQGFAKNLNSILVQSVRGLWNFQAKEILPKSTSQKPKVEKAIVTIANDCIDFYKCFKDYNTHDEIIQKFKKSCIGMEEELINNYTEKVIKALKEVG